MEECPSERRRDNPLTCLNPTRAERTGSAAKNQEPRVEGAENQELRTRGAEDGWDPVPLVPLVPSVPSVPLVPPCPNSSIGSDPIPTRPMEKASQCYGVTDGVSEGGGGGEV